MNERYLKGLILKVCSRCNLDCTYCYMYSRGDLSFLNQPKSMSQATVDQLCERLRNYFSLHQISSFELIMHGGEPTLLGTAGFDKLLTDITRAVGQNTQLSYCIQSNGVLLNEDWIRVFRKHQVSLGISIDGPKQINDLHRRDHQGRSSFDMVTKAISTCTKHGYPFGLLGVQNPESDPYALYEFFKESGAANVDFLFPHHHHDSPPQQSGYADWWISLFDLWFNDNQNDKPNIRFLTQVIVNCLGLGEGFDMLGQQTNDYLVIETDGSIESVDAMKICGDGFTKENYHLQTHSLDQALNAPLMDLYHLSHHKLAGSCLDCPIVSVCGGGFLPHRFSSQNQFYNPSVYCQDLKKIILHIQHSIIDKLSQEAIIEAGLKKFEIL